MFNKKNNTSKNESPSQGRQHPFIKNIKAKLIAENSGDYMKALMEDLRSNNFIFSNN